MKLTCGCLRGAVACIEGSRLVTACKVTYNDGMNTGLWRKFEDARERLEEHLTR